MFEKLAKFRPSQSWHRVLGLSKITAANDNHLQAGTDRVCAKRPRLVCRWYPIEGTNRLACRWELEGSDEPGDSLGRHAAGLHKSFFQLSYQPDRARLADREQPTGRPDQPSTGRPAVLHARHWPAPSGVGQAVAGLQLGAERRELRLSSMCLSECRVG